MSRNAINDLLDRVYKRVGSYDPVKIAKAYDFTVLDTYLDCNTLGTRVTSNRMTTIILNIEMPEWERPRVLLHEIKHCLVDQESSTPFMRRNQLDNSISKIEAEAYYFAVQALIRDYSDEFEGMTKYQIAAALGLDDNWAQFI